MDVFYQYQACERNSNICISLADNLVIDKLLILCNQ